MAGAGAATLVDLLRLRARTLRDATAYTELRDGEAEEGRLSWAGLDEAACRVAARLARTHAPGDRVLLLYPTGLDFMAAYMGCLYAGMVPVPCYPPSRQRPDRRLEGIVGDSGSRIAFTSASVVESIAVQARSFPILEEVTWLTVAETAGEDLGALEGDARVAVAPDDLALMQYTSGSTSEPRGVMVSHRHLLVNLAHLHEGWEHDAASVMVTWLPVFHDMGLIYGALMPLFVGFPCVMMTPAAFLQAPVCWLRAITRYRGTHAAAPNFAYDLCVERVSAEARGELDLASWKMALNAAEPVRAETMERFEEAFRPCGFSPLSFSPGFGLAEATLKVSALGCARRWTSVNVDGDALGRHEVVRTAPGAPGARRLVGCGPEVEATRVTIVDPATRRPVDAGRIGEIWVGGETVPFGYWRRPEATEATFQARLEDGTGPFLRTGDLGFRHEGELHITGRLKDLIIVHGINHYPQDLEWTAERSHPALRPGGGAAFSCEQDGEERVVVVHEVGRVHLKDLDPAPVVAAVRARIFEEHGLALSGVALVKPGGVPKTSSGKVRRSTCRDGWLNGTLDALARWEERVPGASASGSEAGPARDSRAPNADGSTPGPRAIRSWIVARLAAIRGLPERALDPAEPFALSGLDSIRAVRLAGELAAWLGRDVPPTAFYDHPSPAALAAHLGGAAEEGAARAQAPLGARDRSRDHDHAVAIVGMACRFPGADSIDGFWNLVREGRCAIRDLPEGRWDPAVHEPREGEPTVPRRGGFLDGVDRFDAGFFGIAPREAEAMDPQQRLMLEVAWEALECAGRPAPTLAGSRTGVFVGIAHSDYNRLLFEAGHVDSLYAGTGNALSVAAARLSFAWDLRGPSLAVDTACSSSLVAVHLACRSLRAGESDLAIAGGVSLMLSPDWTISFARTGFLSPDGLCKAFDESANGYVRGEGCGCVVLKRLEDAIRDGDSILAVVRGTAVNQDGRSNGLTAPSGPRQVDVIREALLEAELDGAAPLVVEAHGTGTALGDPIEVGALKEALLPGRSEATACRIGSVKTNIGHLESAAGIAGLIKATLMVHHGEIAPSLHCARVSERLGLDAVPMRVAREREPWPADARRIASISSFGFGGTNAHIVLEGPRRDLSGARAANAAPPAAGAAAGAPARAARRIVPISARDPELLAATAAAWADWIERHGDLAAAADLTAHARAALEHRLAITAGSAGEAVDLLRRAARGESDDRIATGRRPASPPSGPVFLYTGQGSQAVGMGRELYEDDPVYRATIDRCDAALAPLAGWSLRAVLHEGPEDRLFAIEVAQPALFALQAALTLAWRERGIRPAAVLGHSAGEIAAAWAAGIFSLEDGLRLAWERGRLMASLMGDERMVAIMASEDDVAGALRALAPRSSIAVYNAPRSIVVSGPRSEIEALAAAYASRGVKATVLRIPLAAHSPHVDPIRDAFGAAVAAVRRSMPRLPFYTNLTGREDGALVAGEGYWFEQVRAPVRFADAIRAAAADGHRFFLEIGPHPTLCGLGEQTVDEDATWAASLHRDLPSDEQMRRAAALLFARGLVPDWSALGARRPRFAPDAPPTLFRRRRYWFDPPAGRAPSRGSSAIARPPAGIEQAYRIAWHESPLSGESAPPASPAARSLWLVAGRDRIAAEELARGLDAAGREARLVEVSSDDPDDVRVRGLEDAACDLARERDALAAGGLVLDADLVPGAVFARAWLLEFLRIIRRLRDEAPGCRVLVATRDAQPVLPGDCLDGVAGALLWGFVKSAMAECPELRFGLIDRGGADAAEPHDLVREIVAGGGEDHVAYRGGVRHVARIARTQEGASRPIAIRPDATYLVTGGLGALASEIALGMADHGATRLALQSRSGVNSPPKEALVAALKQKGVEVLLPRGACATAGEWRQLLDSLESPDKPLRGVIHAAGTPGYRSLAELDAAEIDAVLSAKVFGTESLLEACTDRALAFVVAVSSMTGSWGAGRHAHYTAASHYLDMAAVRAARAGLPVTSVALGPMTGGGMLGDRMIAELGAMGVTCLPLAHGAASLLAHGGGPEPHLVVAAIDWPRYRSVQELRRATRLFEDLGASQGDDGGETIVRGAEASRRADAPPADEGAAPPLAVPPWLAELSMLGDADRDEILLKRILEETCAILKMEVGEWGDPERGFFSAGMDSLTALELKRRLEKATGLALRATIAFDHPNPRALTNHLVEKLGAGRAAARGPAEAAGEERAEDLAARIARLERMVGPS